MDPTQRRKPYFLIPFFIVLFLVVASLAVMMLWNNIVHEVIPGVGMLSYWQATGLLILCRILFGGFHKPHDKRQWMQQHQKEWGGGPWNGGPPWGRQWREMSEDDRKNFREEWKKKRCAWGPTPEKGAEPDTPSQEAPAA